jgi:hypothetical protein
MISAFLRQLKVSVDYGEVMPNIPEMARFFSSVGAALEVATHGRASAGQRFEKPRRACDTSNDRSRSDIHANFATVSNAQLNYKQRPQDRFVKFVGPLRRKRPNSRRSLGFRLLAVPSR